MTNCDIILLIRNCDKFSLKEILLIMKLSKDIHEEIKGLYCFDIKINDFIIDELESIENFTDEEYNNIKKKIKQKIFDKVGDILEEYLLIKEILSYI